MHSHLVTVKVCVVSATDQGVELNRLTLDQDRLKRLNTQSMQCWRAVQHHRMLANNAGQNVPYIGCFAFNHLFCSFDGRCQLHLFELAEDERLKEF